MIYDIAKVSLQARTHAHNLLLMHVQLIVYLATEVVRISLCCSRLASVQNCDVQAYLHVYLPYSTILHTFCALS